MKIRSSYTEVNQEDDYDEVALLAAFDITLIAWNAELKLSLLGQNLRELSCEKGAKDPL